MAQNKPPGTPRVTQTAPEKSLIAALEQIAANAPEEGVTLDALIERLGDRAFGVALFALALPVCVPFLYLVPQIVAVPMLVLAAQMAAGRGEPWLPERLGRRRIARAGLRDMASGGRKWFGWLEALARPRLGFLCGDKAERVSGALFCVFCLSVMIPLPMTNTVPGMGMAAASLGLIMSDGLLVLAGLALGSAWVLMLAIGGPALIYAIVAFARGLIGG